MAVACSNTGFFGAAVVPSKLLYLKGIISLHSGLFCMRFGTVHEAQGVYIDARTATTRWAGERMDYDLAIFGLFSSVACARRVSAETSEH